MTADDISSDTWGTLISDYDPATYGELISGLADRMEISTDKATATIDSAIDTGQLVPQDDSGAFTTWTTPDQGGETEPSAVTTDDPKPIEARTSAAFADAIDWFHQQLDRRIADHLESGTHPDRATTARTYFEDVRGWDAETVADKQLGYAPADGSGLLNHLMDAGYDRDVILGTGLFTESLRPLWQGRYVFPYFDSDGCPVYAISRVTGGEGGGAQGYDGHPADGMSGKYAKPAHTKAYAHIDEPIYGTETIEAGQSVLITEGIADAITAHEAGYACLSPVTTQFKHDDRENLLGVLNVHDIPCVYLIQDAERATSDIDEHGQLTVEQVPAGLKGALATADYLDAHAAETAVALAQLPRPGLDKVDLDDYLQGWSDTLRPVLASAKPANEYLAYDPKEAALTTADGNRKTPDIDPDGEHSGLFDLDVRDVTGLGWDDRTENPLGHHGSSKNYFVLVKDKEVAYDHKYKVAYTALTYLLCDANERRADDPNGRLDDDEILAAWLHAKRERLIPADDPIPHRALVAIAIEEGLCDWDDIEDGWKLPREAYNTALTTVEKKHDVDPGRGPLTGDDSAAGDDGALDPTEINVVIDPERAWHAARSVSPDDLDAAHAAVDEPHAFELDSTTDGWKCPQCDEPVDVVRAAAIERGHCQNCQDPLDDAAYSDAYQRAQREFGAPLPEYVDARLVTERWDLIQGALEQLTHRHLDSIQSDVVSTGGDDPDVLGVIDPCWTDSASGERIVAFRSGQFYCREHKRVLDPVRFVALEEGLLDECGDELAGEAFRDAYQCVRERGAPLPRWICGTPDHAAMLPPAEELVGEFVTEKDRLDEARAKVEAGYRECATDAETMHVRTDDPALGKTTSAVKTAKTVPTLYVGPRKELQQEVEEKAENYGVSSMILPVFGASGDDEMVARAKHIVYEEGQDLLIDREELHGRVADKDEDDGEDDNTDATCEEDDHMARLQATAEANRTAERRDDEDEVDLDRAQCPTASGVHGDAWQLVVHVARELGFSPADIHQTANDLFGEPLPCQCDDHDEESTRCPYSRAWEQVSDPARPIDLLIGSYGHAHVASARTFYERVNDRTEVSPRTIAIDEFPGDAFGRSFGGEALDHAVWVANVLTGDIDTRRDMLDADLWDDDWVRAWLRGEGDEHPASEAANAHLAVAEAWLDVQDAIERARYSVTDIADDTLDRLEAADPQTDMDGVREAHTAVKESWGGPADRTGRQVLNALREFFGAVSALQADFGAIDHGFDGAIGALLDQAMRACQNDDIGRGVITSARNALMGGEDGCRVVAVESDDPYAHPAAYLLLYAAISEMEADPDETKHRIATNEFSWDRKRDGTTVTRSEFDGATILLDDNHKGAYIHDPPAFTARDGSRNPVVGLDATGREELWSLVLGETVETANVHKTARERREFLCDVFNVQVVQTTPDMQFYEGSTGSKNFSADIELVREIAREYGQQRIRADRLESTGKPGVLTTKCVREEIEPQLADDTSVFDNYGNVTGSNELAGCRLGAVLGTQHFGHAPVEKWAALAGEEVTTTGHGNALDYHSEIANAFLGHMTEDQTMQAILRFGRDEGGALVFAHTSALREELPVTADGAVVTAHSATARDVRDAMRPYLRKRASFDVSDILEDAAVDCSRRSVQRILAEFTDLGYLRRHDPGAGRANTFTAMDDPGLGQASLPTVETPSRTDEDPDGSHTSVYYTGSVGVRDDDGPATRPSPAPTTTLPAPEEAATGPPPE